ncbi:MAG: hypothetical protein ACXV6K_08840 [Halobacteriota archaeon]
MDRKQELNAIASKKWTKSFFLSLRELSQIHTEQSGNIRGQSFLTAIDTI